MLSNIVLFLLSGFSQYKLAVIAVVVTSVLGYITHFSYGIYSTIDGLQSSNREFRLQAMKDAGTIALQRQLIGNSKVECASINDAEILERRLNETPNRDTFILNGTLII